MSTIDVSALVEGCHDKSSAAGIRIDTELEPIAGAGGTVKPAIYAGGAYQKDKRWENSGDVEAGPAPVIVIDNIPSQANRLEQALRENVDVTKVPELILDLSELGVLPAHLPRQISSLQFPHRNADAYLRDAKLGDNDFQRTDIGKAIFAATAANCGPLMEWFPQSLLFGFWQSHLGKRKAQTKHARAWVSEIIGWRPASTETRIKGVKGDPYNLSVDQKLSVDANDQSEWSLSESPQEKRTSGEKSDGLSKIGHGQVPFKTGEETLGAVSFARVTQRATLSFAQLRRVSLGNGNPDADAAARALLAALGLCAHQLAFGKGFNLRSGADLRPRATTVTWLGERSDEERELGDAVALLKSAFERATDAGVPLVGWGQRKTLTPKNNLRSAIEKTWPAPGEDD